MRSQWFSQRRHQGSISSGTTVRITSSLPRLTTIRRASPPLIASLTSLAKLIGSPLMLMMTSFSWSPALSQRKGNKSQVICVMICVFWLTGQDETLNHKYHNPAWLARSFTLNLQVNNCCLQGNEGLRRKLLSTIIMHCFYLSFLFSTPRMGNPGLRGPRSSQDFVSTRYIQPLLPSKVEELSAR